MAADYTGLIVSLVVGYLGYRRVRFRWVMMVYSIYIVYLTFFTPLLAILLFVFGLGGLEAMVKLYCIILAITLFNTMFCYALGAAIRRYVKPVITAALNDPTSTLSLLRTLLSRR